jgi:hypothetical protein
MRRKGADVTVGLSPHRRFAKRIALASAFVTILAQPLSAGEGTNVLAQSSSGPLSCEIRKDDKGDAIELIGVAASTRPIAGSAQLNLAKSGPSGVSSSDQSQDFKLQADEQAIVGRATTNLRLGGHVAVDLHLWANGLECRAQATFDR